MTRAFAVMGAIKNEVPPRAKAALLRTWWNGWVTERRFQRGSKGCVMGCCAEDSIEHYAHCPIIGDFSSRGLGLDRGANRIADFLVLNIPASRVAEQRTSKAVLRLAAVYISHCRWRHLRTQGYLQVDSLLQVLRELLGRHPIAEPSSSSSF